MTRSRWRDAGIPAGMAYWIRCLRGGGSTVKMVIVIRVGFLLDCVHGADLVFRRVVQAIKVKGGRACIERIVACSSRNDDCVPVTHRMADIIQIDGYLAFLESRNWSGS